MTSWLLIGGCLLGLLGVEQAQRVLFPGETSLWGWRWGRTRRQEKLKGGDSASRITPQFDRSPDRILKGYSQYCQRLQTDSPLEVEESLRKRLLETRDRYPRVLLGCLLAQASLLLDNREEAHALIEEAEESLRMDWRVLDPTFLAIAETLKQTEALLFLQEGNGPIVLDILDESEKLFGKKRKWIPLIRAETHLLQGDLELCQTCLLSFLKQEESKSGNKPVIDLPPGAWAILGESYLRQGEWEKLDRVLAVCIGLKKLSVEDRAAVLRLKVELFLRDQNSEEVWRTVDEIRDLAKKHEHHRGIARSFHLACARAHFFEGDSREALRRLQLAENESRYPTARQEIEFYRALILETEDRIEDSRLLWTQLSNAPAGTYFAKVARRRCQEIADIPSRIPEAAVSSTIG